MIAAYFVVLLLPLSTFAGECKIAVRDCIEGAGERVIDGRSMYRECWREKISYRCKGYAKNNCVEYDNESYCQLEDSSCKEKVGDWCVASNRTYKCEEVEKFKKKEKRYRVPKIKRDNIGANKRVECGEELKCIDGKCFDEGYEGNDEMGKAVGMLETLKHMQGFDKDNISVFKGQHRECSRKAFGLNPCCSEGKKAFVEKIGLSKCNEGEKELAKLRREDKCYFVGDYKKRFLGVQKSKTYSYCCFDSRVALEINKQARVKGLIKKGWGSAKSPDCTGFTIDDLKGLNFEKIDFSFLSEDLKKRNLWERMGDMNKAFEHTQTLLDDEINKIKDDVVGEGKRESKEGASVNSEHDILDKIDDQKLFEKKGNEYHNDPSTQKKPFGRDRSRDVLDEREVEYHKEEYKSGSNPDVRDDKSREESKKRDYKGL